MAEPSRALGWKTAAQLVVASMVGTGIFTGSGFFLDGVPSGPALLLAWLLGGALSLTGALAYGELCAALPQNGGEYLLLTRIYGPRIGHAAGVVSLLAGFAGSIAVAAHAFGEYGLRAAGLGDTNPTGAAVLALLAMGLLHLLPMRRGMAGQNAFTALKILLTAAAGIALLSLGDFSRIGDAEITLSDALARPAFAGGLVYVAFAYTGWNAAAYVAGETLVPHRNVPRALIVGTGGVMLLYLLFNLAFLAAAPIAALRGEAEVAYVAASHAAGETAARALAALIAFGLLSTVGAFVMTGARVIEAMASKSPRMAVFVRHDPGAPPKGAVVLIVVTSLVLTLSGGLRDLIVYVGVTLSVTALLTVAGVFVLRRREPELARPYRCLGYPLTPFVFCLFTIWMIVFACLESPKGVGGGLVTLVIALASYGRDAPTSINESESR